MARVHCSVNNCHYWDQGNVCSASEIMITSDQEASQLPDSFDAPQASTATPTPVNSCELTCCKTFVEKNSSKIEADSVTKGYY
ncbi:MAG: DUF1540 domain-containing protein [Firmicutes bacterium]|nr:DUF1540 domain-containing protein [Bacillota bacterium]